MDGYSNFGLIDRITQEYLNFLDDSADQKIYVQKIDEMIQDGEVRLIVNMNDVRKRLPERAVGYAFGLVKNFVEEIVCIEQAAKEMIVRANPDYSKAHSQDQDICSEIYVGFEGSFGDRHVNPRSLKSNFLGNMVCCEGIVTKCSNVRPKVVRSVHYCPATKKTLERKYTDLTSYEAFPSSNVYPTEVNSYYICLFDIFYSVDVIADDDLADRVKPGDRIRVVGLFRVLPNKQNGFSNGSFRSILISNNIQLLSKEITPDFDPEDVKNIRRLSKRKDVSYYAFLPDRFLYCLNLLLVLLTGINTYFLKICSTHCFFPVFFVVVYYLNIHNFKHDAERDKMVADHVLKLHRYRAPAEQDGAVLPMGAGVETMSTFDLEGTQKCSEMYEKNADWVANKYFKYYYIILFQ
uniref:DNA helicase n=1 Tax=Heterorhabditis bacteriophora TaxID=37862 RepID=A0A1I7WLX3_HETBA